MAPTLRLLDSRAHGDQPGFPTRRIGWNDLDRVLGGDNLASRNGRTILVFFGIFGGLYLAAVTMRFPEYLLTSGTVAIRVTDLRGIPMECRSGLPRHRSSAPGSATGGFCGSIMTDHGPFQLPEDRFYAFGQSRSEILRGLSEGCVYDVTYYGYGATVHRGMSDTNRHIPKLVRVSGPFGACSAEGLRG